MWSGSPKSTGFRKFVSGWAATGDFAVPRFYGHRTAEPADHNQKCFSGNLYSLGEDNAAITERLILREFMEQDWPAVLAYQSDPLYLRYYEWAGRTPEEVRAFVGMFLAHQQAQPRIKFQLAVTRKADNQLIGNCGIRMDAPGAHRADIGYELAPQHWGQGYATEAARAIVAFGFKTLRVHRIWSWCVADNAGSARVLEKLGMRLEGRLRENEHYKGRWWDTLMFGLLESEWRDQSNTPTLNSTIDDGG